jgi:hypothetical protein
MLYACAAKFDMTGNLEIFWKLNKALNSPQLDQHRYIMARHTMGYGMANDIAE